VQENPQNGQHRQLDIEQQGQQQEGWMDWPEELLAQGQGHLNVNLIPQAVGQDLNLPTPVIQQDLNLAPMEEDPQEVIFNPMQDQE
jgi:hypothetical protein